MSKVSYDNDLKSIINTHEQLRDRMILLLGYLVNKPQNLQEFYSELIFIDYSMASPLRTSGVSPAEGEVLSQLGGLVITEEAIGLQCSSVRSKLGLYTDSSVQHTSLGLMIPHEIFIEMETLMYSTGFYD